MTQSPDFFFEALCF